MTTRYRPHVVTSPGGVSEWSSSTRSVNCRQNLATTSAKETVDEKMQTLSPPARRASSSPKKVASGGASGGGAPPAGPGGRRAACRTSGPRRGRNRQRRAENPGMAYSPMTT
uniref:Uncharacterized protein n=1 Tax=Human herpesvirus 2 TaxID=10310 RepID=A0A481TQW5_HHV2|nr:hypothetical protein [Human alphaherpesvirus 2]QBH85115.1 hypothetical protein [Human alphaherpesvirus 2]